MENKNVLTISDITAAILNGEMTTADAADMFEKQLNASLNAAMEKEAAENAAKVREENIHKSAVTAAKAMFDFIAVSHPDLIPNDFVVTDDMLEEVAKELKDFTEEIISSLPAGIFEAVKYLNNANDSLDAAKEKVDTVKKPQEARTIEVKNFDELLDALAEAGIFSVKPTCEHENLKNPKEDNISKFLRGLGL